MKDLSIVIPVLDEESTLEELYDAICDAISKTALKTFEVIFVDDGSRDKSWEVLEALFKKHPEHICAIRLRRNVGKATALSIGFERSCGEIVITMDADMQDEPGEIPMFLEKINEGYDMVSGWKEVRHDPLSKRLPSKLFNLVTRAFSGMQLNDFNCGFKAYRQEVVDHLNLYGELHRFIPIMVHAEGYRVTEISVHHNPRKFGVSKYGWKRLYKGFLDLLTVITFTRYGQRPAHFFGGIGLLIGLKGFCILSYLTIMKLFFGIGIGTRPLFFLGILEMLFAAQLISTGIIGELIVRNRKQNDHQVYIKTDLKN